MPKEFRSLVYPELSKHLSFLSATEGVDDEPESGAICIYEEILDGAFCIPPLDDIEYLEDGSQVLTYQVLTDPSSDIIVQLVKWSDSHEFLDQIIVQDRLLMRVRNEYGFYRADGKDGDIVRVWFGDVAAGYHDWVTGAQSDERLVREKRFAKEDELIALFDFVLREGDRVDITQLDIPENLFNLLLSDGRADPDNMG